VEWRCPKCGKIDKRWGSQQDIPSEPFSWFKFSSGAFIKGDNPLTLSRPFIDE